MTEKPRTAPTAKTPRKRESSPAPASKPVAEKTVAKKAVAKKRVAKKTVAKKRVAKPAGRPVKAKTGPAKPKAKASKVKSSKGAGPSPSKRAKKAPVTPGMQDGPPAEETPEATQPPEAVVEGPEGYWARQSGAGEPQVEGGRDPKDHFNALQPMTQQLQEPQSFRDLVTQSIDEQPSLGWEKKLLAKWTNRKKK